jgi:CubicO group peptidase (beta-lactamase class C family)
MTARRPGSPPALALALLAFAASVAGQSAPGADSRTAGASIEARLEEIRAKHGVPALGAAATTGERLLALAATGVRKKGADVRVTVGDRWHLGSCTKSMTATMLARLVDRGRLSWDATIGGVFGEDVRGIHEDYRAVTIEQLLANRGGVPADLSAGGLWAALWKRTGSPVDQRRQLLDGVVTRAPETRPGTAFIYANAGFAIAGHMAERATGTAWEDLMRAELFDPLGMTGAGFGSPGRPGEVEQPWGHHGGADAVAVEPGPNADNPPAIGPAGTVHATLADWAKYAALHLRGARGRSDYLKPGSFARIQERPKVGDYAFGWGHHERPWADGHVLAHSGSNTMWFCVIWMAPNRDAAFLAVCNQGGDAAAKATDDAVGALIAALRDELPAPGR